MWETFLTYFYFSNTILIESSEFLAKRMGPPAAASSLSPFSLSFSKGFPRLHCRFKFWIQTLLNLLLNTRLLNSRQRHSNWFYIKQTFEIVFWSCIPLHSKDALNSKFTGGPVINFNISRPKECRVFQFQRCCSRILYSIVVIETSGARKDDNKLTTIEVDTFNVKVKPKRWTTFSGFSLESSQTNLPRKRGQ